MTARQTFVPRPYQTQIIEHILDHPRCGIWAGMGMGKTTATLTALSALELVEPGPALVVAPLRVAQSTWPSEAKKWAHLSDVEIVPIVGTPAQRAAALKKDAPVYTTNYENLPKLVEHFGTRWPFKKIVADESTKLKGFRLRQGGKRAQALGKVAHAHATRFIELTGTPSPNGLIDLWGQAWFLDRGERLGRSFRGFTDRWFRSERVGADPHAVKLEPYPHARGEIENRLRDLCLSLDARDWFDIREPIVTTIEVDLPDAVRKLYNDMEREMFMSFQDNDIEAFNAASRTIKCLQIANGAVYVDEAASAYEEVHDAKLQALEEVIEEAAGMPVLVSYHFKSDLARLQKAFPKGRVLDKDPQTIDDWNAGKIPLLFAHPASAGHGLNLQDGGNILAFFGHWWNLEEFQQIVERIGPTRQAQAGHDRPVFIYHIIARDTVDELVMARRESKREVQDLLLDAMKRNAP
jgi:SNF2 family DNA or RNA helicase